MADGTALLRSAAASPMMNARCGWRVRKGSPGDQKRWAAGNGVFNEMGVRSRGAGAYRTVAPQPGRTAMAASPDDWAKELEAELATLASDMWATHRRLEEKGFRIDGGNKAATGWWLTAINRKLSPGSIRVQSDGATLSVTVEA
jgi:hypothetical protein